MAEWNFTDSVKRAGYSESGCFIHDGANGIFGYRMGTASGIEITHLFDAKMVAQQINPNAYIRLMLETMSEELYRNFGRSRNNGKG